MADAALNFPDVDAEGDLTFSGVEDGSPYGLLSMTSPGLVARIAYADDSPHLHGSLATSGTWQQALISAAVELRGTSEVDLAAKRARLAAALGRLSYPVQQVVNGTPRAWQADMGSMAPDEMDVNDLEEFVEVYALTIPVQPLGA